ncbi:MAG: 4-hydroxy-tetrahydrodipicolinate reductase [Leptospirales bacterium]|nr:4-hydroxy-tetrahydrodipicolinate reductase [Leptospirales bacterium]
MNIAINGIGGRMGNAVLRIMTNRSHKLYAAFESDNSPLINKNAKELINNPLCDCLISAINREALIEVDGVIDFSSPEAAMKLIKLMYEFKKPIVIGTTGFSNEQIDEIKQYSKTGPLVHSPNMSLGVNLLFKLTEIASKALNTEYDVEIFEAHHRNKKDAPSGTAKKLLEIIKGNMIGLSDAAVMNGRGGITGERTANEIGMHAMRGGSIIGEHTVYFTGLDDRIELTHRAVNRDVFATGAVAAMEYLHEKKAGFYTMYDVLGFK